MEVTYMLTPIPQRAKEKALISRALIPQIVRVSRAAATVPDLQQLQFRFASPVPRGRECSRDARPGTEGSRLAPNS
ncbi:hypothetical protein EVAR_80317_1 [Eumeta japonica]|uniref:Uncharacterized protein n=1 Tax=Eumeta variegata TaxID=151549 RepID=A0A4C1UC43_EUMVA|nr:hypothetical protein EVAR_80317_1 [Eumeta japonica]